jgi:hypothetical protein
MGWTLFFMMVVLKIPMIAAGYLIWYAVKAPPEPDGEAEPGSDKGPRRKPPRFPRWPRRGRPSDGSAGCKEPPCPELTPGRTAAPVVARSRQSL